MCTPSKQPSKLLYLPLLTPVPSPPKKASNKKIIVFTELEIQLFLERDMMVGMSDTKFGWKGTTQELKLSVKFPWISLFFIHQNKRVKQSSILRLLLFQSLPVKLTNFLICLLNYRLNKKKKLWTGSYQF